MEFRFSQVFHECILDGLRNVIGESGTKAVLFEIELDRHIEDPRGLHVDLYAIFKEGAFTLEKVIVTELFQRLNLAYDEKSSFDFAGCVSHARELFMKTRKEDCKRLMMCNPQLKTIKTIWPNNSTQISFVVVDSSMTSEYPQNFVCVFPKNLFRRNRKGNLRKSRFFRIFGEKTYRMARDLLEDTLKGETDSNAKMEIATVLKEVREQCLYATKKTSTRRQ